MPEVRQHVSHRVRDFAPRPQHVLMVAIGKDRTAPPKTRVQGLRHADSEPLHRSSERRRALALHDQVEVIPLNGRVDDPRPEPLARLVQSSQQRARGCLPSQISNRRPEPLRHVNRAARRKSGSRRMRPGPISPGCARLRGRPAPLRRPPHVAQLETRILLRGEADRSPSRAVRSIPCRREAARGGSTSASPALRGPLPLASLEDAARGAARDSLRAGERAEALLSKNSA
jgi:hypothetical protein